MRPAPKPRKNSPKNAKPTVFPPVLPRSPQANLDLYLRILNRPGGEPPRPGDEA